jgi:hypothetical protein
MRRVGFDASVGDILEAASLQDARAVGTEAAVGAMFGHNGFWLGHREGPASEPITSAAGCNRLATTHGSCQRSTFARTARDKRTISAMLRQSPKLSSAGTAPGANKGTIEEKESYR